MKRFRLDDLPLLVKVGFAPALALTMLAALAAGAIVIQRTQVRELDQVVQVDMPNGLRMQRISERIANVHGQLYLLLTHQAAKIDSDKIGAQGKALLAEVDSIAKDISLAQAAAAPDQREAYDKLGKELKETRDALDVIIAMTGADFASAAGFAQPFEDQYAKMTGQLQSIVAATKAQTELSAEAARHRSQLSQGLTVVASLITLLLAGAIALVLVLDMRRAVGRIAAATERLSQGDNDVDLAALQRADEMGAIIQSLTVFRDNQLQIERLRAEQEEARRNAEAAQREAAEVAEAQARSQTLVVSSLAEALERLAAGDLTIQINTAFPGAYEKLRTDFNRAVTELESALTAIARATFAIRSGGVEIARGAQELSQRTERQAATLEETAAALDEITATVQRSAEGAGESQQAVAAAKADAERSGDVVGRAVASMSEIERSAREISQIISVVDEIAFQTNLLALNAGVEAARAGDAGKGFAVVASEVRALAQRSAEAAKQIKGLISTSSAQVVEGVALVGEAGDALNRILAHVSSIDRLASDIAASAKEEATGIREVNAAVNQMDQATQQNAVMVEETSSASHMLADQSEELFRLVCRFRVSDAAPEVAPAAANQATSGRRAPRLVHSAGAGAGAPAWVEF
jgi:methyl-accepting chemotaxis protein